MTPELRSAIIHPTPTYAVRLAAMGLGWGLIGASLMFAATPPTMVQAPPITLTETVTLPMIEPAMVTAEAMPVPSASSVSLVFEAGGATYMKLGDASKQQVHGAVRLDGGEDGVYSTIAPVTETDLPAADRVWKGREVIVDGACHATVTGFAVIARVTGDPTYSEAADDPNAWTANQVMKDGSSVVAARLDGCKGGELARDAALPPMIVPTVITDTSLVAAATKLLFASADAEAARRAWVEWEDGAMEHGTKLELEPLETLVVHHPITGVTYVSVHGNAGGGCGAPDVHLWGLYRVDAGGALTRIKTSRGELVTIEKLVDIEGDGTLEVIGRPWLGAERTVNRVTGETLEQLELPFYGCAC